MENKLWYTGAANNWSEGLPIGNGRLAAMVLNYDSEDVLALNHEFLWTGFNRERKIYYTPDALEKVREMLEREEYEKANCYANDFLGRDGDKSKFLNRLDSFQPAGNLHIEFNDAHLNKRILDIENGVAKSQRESGGGIVRSSVLAHCKLNNILCRWTDVSDAKIFFEREKDERLLSNTEISEREIRYNAEFISGMSYSVNVRIYTDGEAVYTDRFIRVKKASYLVAVINIGTDVVGIEKELDLYKIPKHIDFKSADDWNELCGEHTDLFSSYMQRVCLKIDADEFVGPTDKRLAAFKNGSADENLFALYLNYGRYLLLSSSICGCLPANLQGKWNGDIEPAWHSDYHFDINIQMNYWLAENGNLGETTNAMFDYIDLFKESGEAAAKCVYGCRGILLPLSSDCWGISSQESYGWDIWIGAAAWIAQHYYKHYEYTGDKDFLKNRAYPYLKSVIEFYEDYLIRDENGVYQIIPSVSPENSFLKNKDINISLGISSAMDIQLAYDCFTYIIDSAKILGVDSEKIEYWRNIRDNLPEFKIGSDGRLLEWNKGFSEREPGHRHFSHLYGVFPSNLFTPEKNCKQYNAAKKSLDFRLSHFGGHTGWSRAWCACLYARFGKGSEFYKHMRYLIDNYSTPSLLDLHPPGIFQIDGNLGGAEAIIQALVQCKDGKIYLLPALPENWQNGEISGVKTIGGHTLSIEWKDGCISRINIEFGYENEVVFKFNDGYELKMTSESNAIKNYEI